jgi:hypothetical protein
MVIESGPANSNGEKIKILNLGEKKNQLRWWGDPFWPKGVYISL